VRRILAGSAPADESENRIYGLKNSLAFISNPDHDMTADNIHTLYETAVGNWLTNGDDKLLPGSLYRHDSVFVMGMQAEHTGLSYRKLPAYMDSLIAFIQSCAAMDDLIKSAVIHYYVAYLHPWFDGNGRMARLMQLWYLRRRGYPSALYIPFSSYLHRSRRAYYQAYTQIADNAKISGVTDITPFLVYFSDNVYSRLEAAAPHPDVLSDYIGALKSGQVTLREKELWNFVLSSYGRSEFSTKQLERDFGGAAYATIRTFVLKFTNMGLLEASRYGNRNRYRIAGK